MASQAEGLARRLLDRTDLGDADRIRAAYQLCYARPADSQEIERLLRFVDDYVEQAEGPQADGRDVRLDAWTAVGRVLLSSNEFLYLN